MASKCLSVLEHVKKKVACGEWTKGQRLPSEAQMQEELGVSRTTVREALSALANEGLIVRRQRAGSFICDDKLDNGHGIIALLAPLDHIASSGGHYYKSLISHAQKLVGQSDFRSVIAIGHGATVDEFANSVHLFDNPVSKNIVGVLSIVGLGQMKEKVRQANMCCVTIDEPGMSATNCVLLCYEQLVSMGIEHLKAHGHFDFAMVYCDTPEAEGEARSIQRKEKFRSWIKACGIELKENRLLPIPFHDGRNDAYRILKEFLVSPDRPKAVFFADDIICENGTRAILELGIKVPEELSIITQSNEGHEIPFPVPLTKLEISASEVVNTAWHMLKTMIETKSQERPYVYIYPKLRIGQSVAYV